MGMVKCTGVIFMGYVSTGVKALAGLSPHYASFGSEVASEPISENVSNATPADDA